MASRHISRTTPDFVADCCRYLGGVLTEAAIKSKYHFDDGTWENLGDNDALIEAIEDEKTRRVRNGCKNANARSNSLCRRPTS